MSKKVQRPTYLSAWFRFKQIDLEPGELRHRTAMEVGRQIGGKVQFNFDTNPKKFGNACAIRLSYVLNKTGVKIPYGPGRGSGRDGEWYFYRVKDITAFAEQTFGPAEIDITLADRGKLAKQKGLYAVEGSGFNDATGHMSLWNDTEAADHDYLNHVTFKPERIRLWLLP